MSVPTGGGYYQASPEVSLDWISKGWSYFTQKAAIWVSAMLALFVIGIGLWLVIAIPTGLLNMMQAMIQSGARGGGGPGGFAPPTFGPLYYILVFLVAGVAHILMGGVFRMALRQIRGEEVAVGDIFQIGDVAAPLFISGLITSILSTIGFYLCVIPGFIIYGLLMFVPLIIVDRKIGPIDAIKASVEMLKPQWLMCAVFYFLVSLVAGLGGLVCGVGALATYPLLFLATAYGYFMFTEPMRAAPDFGAAQPGVWPPPPGAQALPQFGQSGNYAPPPSQPAEWPAPPSASPPAAPQPGQWPSPETPQAPPPSAPSAWPSQTPPPPLPPAGEEPTEDGPNRPFGGV